jgi:hypothetical protein
MQSPNSNLICVHKRKSNLISIYSKEKESRNVKNLFQNLIKKLHQNNLKNWNWKRKNVFVI